MKVDNGGNRYEFKYKEDGVYLRALVCGTENAMSEADLLKLIQDKDINDVDYDAVNRVYHMGEGTEELIAPPQEEFYQDDFFDVTVPEGGMEARITLCRGEEEGNRLTKNDIINRLSDDYKITSGIDMDAISTMITDNIYGEEKIIAVGQSAVDGIDGEVTYLFDTNYNKIGQEVDGRIDFKQLNLFANVTRGQVIATKTEPIPGKDGYDIYGKILKAKAAKEARFQYGKNVFPSQNGETLLAGIDGKADLVGNKVVVSKVYTVNGNVDMSIGNIDFNGDVVITGSVMAGFEVKAGGSVDIYGIVEGAQIHAGENIRVMSSFLGNGRGMLEAGGSVICKSVEQGIIKAGINIEADVVMHSNLWCEGSIKVNGEKSSVIGGNICSCKEIILNNVGNVKGTATSLRIEMPSDTLKRLAEIDEERKQLDTLIQSLERKRDAAMNSGVELNEKVKIVNGLLSAQKSLEKNIEIKEKLTTMMDNVKNGKIEIRGRGYNGVDIYINSIVKKIDFTVDYTTFFVRDGEIQEIPCK